MSEVKNFDLGYLSESVGDDEDFYKMLAIFTESTPKILSELNESYITNDMRGVADSAHKLKSTIDILRINELQDQIRRIDRLPHVIENKNELPQIISHIMDVMHRVLWEIRRDYLS
jgi:HPt (histidine-containing phosphotransfer) domain-containing protein